MSAFMLGSSNNVIPLRISINTFTFDLICESLAVFFVFVAIAFLRFHDDVIIAFVLQEPQDNVFVHVGPGQTYKYMYQISKEQPAGTYWYHPHLHGSTMFQVSVSVSVPISGWQPLSTSFL